MSVGPLGVIGSLAGTPLSQTKGTDTDKTAQHVADQARETAANQNAERASGIGQAEQDEQASERDADGRRPWEQNAQPGQSDDAHRPLGPQPLAGAHPKNRDATGLKGNQLDLTG